MHCTQDSVWSLWANRQLACLLQLAVHISTDRYDNTYCVTRDETEDAWGASLTCSSMLELNDGHSGMQYPLHLSSNHPGTEQLLT